MSAWDEYKKTMAAPLSLGVAARANDLALIDQLLASGVPIDERDPRGYSPLMLAAYNGHHEAFDLLITRGADVNSTDVAGNSVLMGAAFKGHLEMVKKLVAAGADLRARNAQGADAIAFAQLFGRHDVAAYLQTHTTQEA